MKTNSLVSKLKIHYLCSIRSSSRKIDLEFFNLFSCDHGQLAYCGFCAGGGVTLFIRDFFFAIFQKNFFFQNFRKKKTQNPVQPNS